MQPSHPVPILDTLSQKPPKDVPIFGYGAARRPGTVKSERSEFSDPLASLFETGTELYDAEDILIKLHHRAAIDEQGKDKRRLVQIKQLLAEILPDVIDADDINILGPEIIGDPEEPSGVRFKTPYWLCSPVWLEPWVPNHSYVGN